MFEIIYKGLVLAALSLGAYHFAQLRKEVAKMAEDLTKLKEAQAANAQAVDNAVTEINDLVTRLANTQPSNQSAIDEITEALNAKTAALAAAAKAGQPTAPTA
jgi:uncharacterized protein YigA (DUF484 family)